MPDFHLRDRFLTNPSLNWMPLLCPVCFKHLFYHTARLLCVNGMKDQCWRKWRACSCSSITQHPRKWGEHWSRALVAAGQQCHQKSGFSAEAPCELEQNNSKRSNLAHTGPNSGLSTELHGQWNHRLWVICWEQGCFFLRISMDVPL